MNKLYSAGKQAIVGSLKVKKGERLLLVTDKQKMPIAEALAHWANAQGAEVTTYLMTETLRPITKPTSIFKAMIEAADVTMYMLDARVEEKPFRGFMVANGSKFGRICMMPGITVDMMERLVNIDFSKMDALTKRVMRIMKDCPDVRVTNRLGTDIAFSVEGRTWENDNGDISVAGKHGNLPAGECYTAPVERTFTGRLVVSLIDDRIGRGEMIFKRGVLVNWRGAGIDSPGRRAIATALVLLDTTMDYYGIALPLHDDGLHAETTLQVDGGDITRATLTTAAFVSSTAHQAEDHDHRDQKHYLPHVDLLVKRTGFVFGWRLRRQAGHAARSAHIVAQMRSEGNPALFLVQVRRQDFRLPWPGFSGR